MTKLSVRIWICELAYRERVFKGFQPGINEDKRGKHHGCAYYSRNFYEAAGLLSHNQVNQQTNGEYQRSDQCGLAGKQKNDDGEKEIGCKQPSVPSCVLLRPDKYEN